MMSRVAAGLAGWLKEIGWGSPGFATTSDQAIDWINRHGVDVLVCDVAIKPVDGLRCERHPAAFPAMRTIFISGYDLSKYRVRMAACQFLPKPVTGEALDKAIRRFFEPKEPGAIAVGNAARAMPVPTGNGQIAPGSIAASPRVTALPRVVRAVSPPMHAKPRLKDVARPVVIPSKASPAQARTPTAPGWEVQLPADHLWEGPWEIIRLRPESSRAPKCPFYRALQTNFGRQVRLYTLDRTSPRSRPRSRNSCWTPASRPMCDILIFWLFMRPGRATASTSILANMFLPVHSIIARFGDFFGGKVGSPGDEGGGGSAGVFLARKYHAQSNY